MTSCLINIICICELFLLLTSPGSNIAASSLQRISFTCFCYKQNRLKPEFQQNIQRHACVRHSVLPSLDGVSGKQLVTCYLQHDVTDQTYRIQNKVSYLYAINRNLIAAVKGPGHVYDLFINCCSSNLREHGDFGSCCDCDDTNGGTPTTRGRRKMHYV